MVNEVTSEGFFKGFQFGNRFYVVKEIIPNLRALVLEIYFYSNNRCNGQYRIFSCVATTVYAFYRKYMGGHERINLFILKLNI